MSEPTVTWTGSNREEIAEFQRDAEAIWSFSVGMPRRPHSRFWRTVRWLCEHVPERFGYPEWYPPDDPSLLHLVWFTPVDPPEFPSDLVNKVFEFQMALPSGPIRVSDMRDTLEHVRPELTSWAERCGHHQLESATARPGDRITPTGRVIPGTVPEIEQEDETDDHG